MKVMLVFGTRPEAIKMCPLVIELNKCRNITTIVCLTGQHREMLIPVMDMFRVKEDYNLDIMRDGQSLDDVTVKVIKGVGEILDMEKPDILLVHGDTTSSYAAAIAAFYRGIRIGHVEAGLRTYNMHAPYPEEFNRQSIDLMSNYYFAPTENAAKKLINEGKKVEDIYVTGNTVIDALHYTINDQYNDEMLNSVKGRRIIIMTVHRRENLGEPMRNIFRAIRRIAIEYTDVCFVYPVHCNSAVKTIANEELCNIENVLMIDPVTVDVFHNYLYRCYMAVTDSGGIQEEAVALGIPTLVVRDVTERAEGIETGTLRLVGTDLDAIYINMRTLLDNDIEYEKMRKTSNIYGDGQATKRITQILLDGYIKRES